MSLKDKLAQKARERVAARSNPEVGEDVERARALELHNAWAEAMDRKRAAESARIEEEEIKHHKCLEIDLSGSMSHDDEDAVPDMYSDGSYWRTAGACLELHVLHDIMCPLTCTHMHVSIMCTHAVTYGLQARPSTLEHATAMANLDEWSDRQLMHWLTTLDQESCVRLHGLMLRLFPELGNLQRGDEAVTEHPSSHNHEHGRVPPSPAPAAIPTVPEPPHVEPVEPKPEEGTRLHVHTHT